MEISDIFVIFIIAIMFHYWFTYLLSQSCQTTEHFSEDDLRNVSSIYYDDGMSVSKLKITDNINISGKLILNNELITLPAGVIVAWTGKTAPEGWALCDGNNGTPNLQHRFILGWDPAEKDSIGKTGGEAYHVLTEDEMPKHAHTSVPDIFTSGKQQHWASGNNTNWWDSNGYRHAATLNTGSSGDGHPHDNMPPYRILSYIMKLGNQAPSVPGPVATTPGIDYPTFKDRGYVCEKRSDNKYVLKTDKVCISQKKKSTLHNENLNACHGFDKKEECEAYLNVGSCVIL